MTDVLIVVDMQNDFVSGALGSKEAIAIVPGLVEEVKAAKLRGDKLIFTRDTHLPDYLNTQEGKNLPVSHCIRGENGWEIIDELQEFAAESLVIDKPSFGSRALGEILDKMNAEDKLGTITLVGLCTDICVISNAMLIKAFLPEVPIRVIAACCAGVSPVSHERALEAMAVCQIEIAR